MYETTIVPHNVNFHIVFDYDLPYILIYTLIIHEATLQPIFLLQLLEDRSDAKKSWTIFILLL